MIGPRTNGYVFRDSNGLDVADGKAANHPVETVDWYDCVKWCNARSQQAGLTPVYYTDAGFDAGVSRMGTVARTVYANWAAMAIGCRRRRSGRRRRGAA